jgi:mRNA interferase MazF
VICKPFEVAIVPFPFTNSAQQKRRPALVLSAADFNRVNGHALLAMITSAENAPWAGDVVVDAAAAGLSAPSKVRIKLFTLDLRLVLRVVGMIAPGDQRRVLHSLRTTLSI